jgi:hypothetical protein
MTMAALVDMVQVAPERSASDDVRSRKDPSKVAATKAWLASKPDWWREAYDEANRRDQARLRGR